MTTGTPLTITLYGADDEIEKTYSRIVVPWGILKRAVRLSKELDLENMDETGVDALAGLVVEAFGNQFSIAELDEKADVSDMISVITIIVNKANGIMPTSNPTKPA